MKRFYSIFLVVGGISSIMFCSGCATVEEPKYIPVKDFEMRLVHAKKERETWLRLLQHAQSVDEAVKVRENLEHIQTNIEDLETGRKTQKDLDAGFESTKKRTVIYGPIGVVLVGAKWITEKCFILYPWNWRAF